jgi:hypothetical protein
MAAPEADSPFRNTAATQRETLEESTLWAGKYAALWGRMCPRLGKGLNSIFAE